MSNTLELLVAHLMLTFLKIRDKNTFQKHCIFLGNGNTTKGYRLYNLTINRLIFSRDVKFNENNFNSSTSLEISDSTEPFHYLANFSDNNGSDGDHASDYNRSDQNSETRKSIRLKKTPNRYGEWELVTNPQSVREALSGPLKSQWKTAMEKKIKSINEHDVWELVPLPLNRKVINSKWVFMEKSGADGLVQTHEARLVARGYSQQFGQDYDETFSPIVRFESLRTIIAILLKMI